MSEPELLKCPDCGGTYFVKVDQYEKAAHAKTLLTAPYGGIIGCWRCKRRYMYDNENKTWRAL